MGFVTPVVEGLAACASLSGARALGFLVRWFFEGVNQVLVRLWAPCPICRAHNPAGLVASLTDKGSWKRGLVAAGQVVFRGVCERHV